MLSDEIVWLRKNPFDWDRKGLIIRVYVGDERPGDPMVCLDAGLKSDERIGSRPAPSIDVALAIILEGISSAIASHAIQAMSDLKTEGDVDDLWDLLRALVAYQLHVQKSLHFHVTGPFSMTLN